MKKFADAQQMHKDYPTTFQAPSIKKLEKLKVGDFVKVRHDDEAFWTIISKIDENTITATVDNVLDNEHPFEFGDEIEFEKKNIFSIC